MEGYLLSAQVAAIVTYVGATFWLYKVYTKLLDGRIKKEQEEVQRLCRQLEELREQQKTPSDYKAQLDFAEAINNKKLEQLQKEKQEAISQGDKALEKEKAEKIEKINQWAKAYKKLDDEVAVYKKADAEREASRKAITESLKNFRVADSYKGVDAVVRAMGQFPLDLSYLGTTPPLPDLTFLQTLCPSCTISPSRCKSCQKSFCTVHMPEGSIGVGVNLLCGNCRDPEQSRANKLFGDPIK